MAKAKTKRETKTETKTIVKPTKVEVSATKVKPVKLVEVEKPLDAPIKKKFKKVTIETDCGLKVIEVEVR